MIAFRCVVAAICAMALSPEATKEANAAIVTEIIATGTSVVANNINIAGGGSPFFTYNPNNAHFGAVLSACSSVDSFPLCNVGGAS